MLGISPTVILLVLIAFQGGLGSIWVARRAGRYPATRAMMLINSAAAAKLVGSTGATPNNRFFVSRARTHRKDPMAAMGAQGIQFITGRSIIAKLRTLWDWCRGVTRAADGSNDVRGDGSCNQCSCGW